MLNLTKCLIFFILALTSSHSLSNNNCINADINTASQSTHITIPTNIPQCININNHTNEKIALISNSLGSKVNIISSNTPVKNIAIAGDSYFLLSNQKHIEAEIYVQSSAVKHIKISASTELQAENIIFQNNAINFLLLGIIFSGVTFNFLYAALNRSKASLLLGLLTSLTIIYFMFESSSNQLTISDETLETLTKTLSLGSCLAGLVLMHTLIKSKSPITTTISMLFIVFFTIGLHPIVPLDIFRLCFIAVIIHVFTNIVINCRHNTYLYWYLAGSSIPSIMSISLMLINEFLPTIASYNLMLIAVFLQNIFICKALFKEKELSTKNVNDKEIIQSTDVRSEYLNSCKAMLLPQLAGVSQLIKHATPLISKAISDSSIANLQLIELRLKAATPPTSKQQAFELANTLINTIHNSNPSQSATQRNDAMLLLYSQTNETIINIARDIIEKISEQFSGLIEYSVISPNRLFLSLHHEQLTVNHIQYKKWLIIDDNENLLSIISAQCAAIGQEALTATTPVAAIDLFLNNAMAVTDILIDWNLRFETAHHAIKQITAIVRQHKLDQPTIHIMSAQKIYSANFSDFPLVEVLEKPITIDKLKKIKTAQ